MFPRGTEKCKKIGFIFISIVLLMVLFSSFASAYSAGSAGIGSTVVNPGVNFSLPLFVEDASGMEQLSLDVIFNGSSLLMGSIVADSALSEAEMDYYIDNSTGFANMTIRSVNISNEGQTNVADIHFISLESGNYTILLHNVSFTNDSASYAANSAINGTVRVNYPPKIGYIDDMVVNAGSYLEFTIPATDEDDQTLVYEVQDLPSGYEINSTSGLFSWTPELADNYSANFSVSDGLAIDFQYVNITVNENTSNQAPELEFIGDRTVTEDELLAITLSGTDDDDDTLSYSTNASFGTLTGNVFEWTPDFDDSGTYDVEFSVSDGIATDSEFVTITVTDVNRAPELVTIGDKSINEGAELSFIISGTDPDHDSLTYSATTLPDGSDFDPGIREFSWTPGYEDSGTHNATFIVSDGNLSDSATITITVLNVDQPPVIDPIGDKSIDENSLLSFIISATDPDGETVNYSAGGLPSGATLDTATGEFVWKPGYDASGSYDVEFIASSNGLEDSELITITVSDVNRAPFIETISDKLVNENEELIISIIAGDDDGDTLSYSTTASFGTLTDNTFRWTPGFDDSGTYYVDFSVSDGIATDSEIVTITVTDVNRVPELEFIGDRTVTEDELLAITLSGTDDDDDTLSYSTNASFGTLTGNVFEWTPDFDDSGTYDVEFSVSDGIATDSEFVTITVTDVNRAPELVTIGDKSINEGAELSFIISGTDPDHDSLTYSATTLPDGSDFDPGIREFSWTPGYEDSGTHNATFIVSDGNLSDSATITITVLNVDQPPVIDPIGDKSIDENSLLSFIISATDPDGETVNYSAGGLPSGATLDTATGEFVWKPGYDASGSYDVEFIASSNGLEDSELITITVSDVNRAPFIETISDKLVNENEELIISIIAGDDDGDTLSYSTTASFGTLTDNTFRWTPGFDDSGLYDVNFTVSDGELSDTETVRIAVGNTNVPPVLDPIGTKMVDENQLLSFSIIASDEDSGDTLTYSASGLPPGASFDPAKRLFSWVPSYEQAGSYNVIFEVYDGMFIDTELVTIVVDNSNRAPVISPIGNRNVDEGSRLYFTISADDPDMDDLSYSATDLPEGSVFSESSLEFSWTPDYDDSGSYDITFRVTDGNLSDSTTISISVNDVNRAPVLDTIGNKAVSEGEELSFIITGYDADSDPLTYSADDLPPNAVFDPFTREFTWTPGFDDSGIYNMTFTVSDGSLSDSETVSISVGSVNRAPELTTIGDMTVNEGSEMSFIISGTDPDLDQLSYSADDLPEDATFDAGIREFIWTPGYDDSGTYDITFTVSDGSISDSETISVYVVDVNRAPVLDTIGNKVVSEGSELRFNVSADDPDPDTLSYSATDLPSGATFSEDTLEFIWTPGYDDSGTYFVTFKASDGSLSDSEKITISVGSVNRPPVLDPIGNKEIDENSELSFTISGTDPDPDTLIYSASTLPSGADFNAYTRQFQWHTGYDDSGTYDITFTVNDGSISDSETISINVHNVNRAPVMDPIGNKVASEGSELVFTVSGSDADQDHLTYSASGLPTGANFDKSTREFTWTPGYDDSGTYDVTFTVSDGYLPDSETISINVGAVNRPPEISTIGDRNVNESSELRFTVSASDPDPEDTLSYSAAGLPKGASFDADTREFIWTPSYDDSGSYSVVFKVSDGSLSDSEAVEINVIHVNRAPVLMVVGPQEVNENDELVIELEANDEDGDVLDYSLIDPPEGSQVDGSTGRFTWAPSYDQAKSYTVRFVVSDGLEEDTEDVEITVKNVNRPPVMAIPEQLYVAENNTLELDLNASDPDGDMLEYSKDSEIGSLQGSIFSPCA